MNYIILDLEATCWEQQSYHHRPNEIIEIGALKINEQKEILGEFQRFIKPIKYPILSNFCKELTSITQEEISHADYFYNVIEEFKEWFGYPNEPYYLCSWGFYDKKQFESDCQLHHLDFDWTENHISLKHQFRNIKGLRRAIGMKNALISENITLDGTHHRGIDDARNIAKIFLRYFDDWKYNTILS